MTFIIGQRWISNSESHLGLGIITEFSGRQVGIRFPAANEDRLYAIDNAPLSRIIFKEGDEIVTDNEQTLTVTAVEEKQGIVLYTAVDAHGSEVQVNELSLNCFIKLSTPEQRLFSGLVDKLNAFKLRIDSLNHAARLQQSKVQGLLGARTNHLPHQVYIAAEVAKRYAPRVLLADEVGLGKTIEAGMILHYQLHTGRAQRVLIVVPNSLIHQWLVEMIRRFNLHFSIYDQQRFDRSYEDMDEDEFALPLENDNLFEQEQLVLCSLEFLMENTEARKQAIEAEWDLLVIDEAHHLQWSVESVSLEYACVEQLAAHSKGLLLLTATPEQVGIQGHFARLRLLDPSRFFDFAEFQREEEGYQQINQLVQQILSHQEQNSNEPLPSELQKQLQTYLGENLPSDLSELIKNLLDRHGTGRVLFRNTRAAIQGFPKRELLSYPLPKPSLYDHLSPAHQKANLYPEITLNNLDWLTQDPRVNWLAEQIQQLRGKKILIICAHATTALALEHFLKLNKGIRSTAFHEHLSIIERDRAAAYFAEDEQGAQVLICSEIGSEGRNFQFAHHLILFDLPLNPDLLEQRIGRLDRIGQKQDIQIHVPYLMHTAQEKLFRWYHEGIQLFTQSCSAAFSIYDHFAEQLLPLLYAENQVEDALNQLITATAHYTAELNQRLHQGRDKLLEMNSCNLPKALDLIAEIEAEENSLELEDYMAKVYQEFGVDHEFHSNSTEILRPTDHMKTGHFPGLEEDGITVTYSRLKGLVREDIQFLSWEHPIVNESMEMILNSEIGNVTLTTISLKNIAPGTLFLETFFTINCAAPKSLQLNRILPLTTIRVLSNISGKNLSKVLSYDQLNTLCEPVKRHLAYPIVKQIRPDIELILSFCNQVAEQSKEEILAQAKTSMRTDLEQEIQRLEALQKINPSVRQEEIDYFKQQIVDSDFYLANAELNLQALRVVINK
ncbi:MAG: RNA polymerase-associated protein RapA [Legionella sp.]|nr:MAG: RNA polymerase-associated protein RapA [Legionella sp.]